MRRFKEKMIRFFYGRNGVDSLYQATMWVCIGLLVLNMLLHSWILLLLEMGLLIWASFRMLSRNVYARQKENRAFLGFWKKIKGWFSLCRNRFRDRKTHIYRKCPQCKNTLRLPKVKGDHTVACPCCQNRFSVRV